MMFCPNCGTKNDPEDLFCKSCGEPLQDANPTHSVDSLADDVKNQEEKDSEKKPIKWKILIPVISAVIVLLIALGVFLACSFPLEISFSSQDTLTTSTGIFEDFYVDIESNQPIKEVYYSVAPKDPTDMKAYTKIKADGIYEKNVSIEKLHVPVGKNTMYICVTTLFGGRQYYEIELEFDIGYVSAPLLDSIVEYDEAKNMVSNEIIVTVKDDTPYEDVEELAEEYGGEIVGAIYPINQYQIRFDQGGESIVENKIKKFQNSDLVESATYNMLYETSSDVFPKDSKFDSWTDTKTKAKGNNWGLEVIGAPAAWEYSKDMQVIKVGVIDTMLDNDHEDLRIEDDKCYFYPTNDFKTQEEFFEYYDKQKKKHKFCLDINCNLCGEVVNHGTHVSGIIGALKNNDGICGVNWNTDIMFASNWFIYKNNGNFLTYNSTAMINMSLTHCVMSGSRVVNMSFGSTKPSTVDNKEKAAAKALDDLVAKLDKKGYDFLICKSAGNDGDDSSDYELNRIFTTGKNVRAHTIMVGAISNNMNKYRKTGEKYYEKAGFSNYGDIVDIMAPGNNIYSTVRNDKYASWDGTSMATPMVAGVASMLYGLNPDITYDYVKDVLLNYHEFWAIHKKKHYPVLDAQSAIEFVVNEDWDDPEKKKEPKVPQLGYVYGDIQDAETEEFLNKASLVCVAEDGTEYPAGVYYGKYQCQLPQGTYDMKFSCKDYISETIYGVEVANDVITYNVMLNMIKNKQEKGTASGYIIDAFDASRIANASISIYRGLNCTEGTAVKNLTADSNGYYEVELTPGNYTVVAESSGYQKGFGNIIVLSGETRKNQDCVLIPVLKEGEIRIVLTWGAYPSDLDSHLVGPAPGGRFHTYYSNKDHYHDGVRYCNLDVDDTSSYGPETTSVYVGQNGTYTYYIHDFSNRGANTSNAMATSGAVVKVYVAGQATPKIFNVPPKTGTLWEVCKIRNGVITPVNKVTNMADPGRVGENTSVN